MKLAKIYRYLGGRGEDGFDSSADHGKHEIQRPCIKYTTITSKCETIYVHTDGEHDLAFTLYTDYDAPSASFWAECGVGINHAVAKIRQGLT